MLDHAARRVRDWAVRCLETIGVGFVGIYGIPGSLAGDEMATGVVPDWEGAGDWIGYHDCRRVTPSASSCTSSAESSYGDGRARRDGGWKYVLGADDTGGKRADCNSRRPEDRDPLSAWTQLYERVQRGEIGGPADGSPLT